MAILNLSGSCWKQPDVIIIKKKAKLYVNMTVLSIIVLLRATLQRPPAGL